MLLEQPLLFLRIRRGGLLGSNRLVIGLAAAAVQPCLLIRRETRVRRGRRGVLRSFSLSSRVGRPLLSRRHVALQRLFFGGVRSLLRRPPLTRLLASDLLVDGLQPRLRGLARVTEGL